MSSGDPFESMRLRLASVQRSLSWNPADSGWTARARAAVSDAVGVVNEPWPDPVLHMGDSTSADGYRRIRVEFPSHAGWDARGWLMIPDGVKAQSPAVVCLPGHGAGVDEIVGLTAATYHADFALQSVREGWVTLAVEQISFGSNRSSREVNGQSSCTIDSMAALLLGETMTGWRVRDASAGRRALSTLPEVDPARIGVIGISGGGLTTLWSAALDPEFLAAGVSGYFCPMFQSIMNVAHCPDNYVPGFGLLMDIPDLAGLIAPRWLAVENGTLDTIFTKEGFKQACELAEQIYAKSPERFTSDLFEGDHVFNGRKILPHFHKAFAR